MTTHSLTITTTYADGHESTWTYYNQPGTAQDAHDALARRWKNAGHEFGRDKANRVLTRTYGAERIGEPYTDEIRHEED